MNAINPVAVRTRPEAQPRATAHGILRDRVLTLVNADRAEAIVGELGIKHEGLVLLGAKRHPTMKRLRRAFPDLVLMAEPPSHVDLEASPEMLWHRPGAQFDGLIPAPSVVDIVDAQRQSGSSVALLPAGFVGTGDTETLRALVEAANGIEGDDIALPLYLADGWLKSEHKDYLRAIVQASVHPVLLAIGSTTNPLNTPKKLRVYLDVASSGAYCWRTDLAGLGALASGALGAAIGAGAASRRVTPPQSKGHARWPQDTTPYVLIPGHMHWMKTGAMRAEIYMGSPAPECKCRECAGRRIDQFGEDQADQAARHNHAIIDEYARALLGVREPERGAVWRTLAQDALVAHEVTGATIGRPWKPPADVTTFAEG